MQGMLRGVCLLVILAIAPSTGATPLRLVGDRWPPYVDSLLPEGGIATAIVTTALARAGFTSQFQQLPWARAIQGVGDGRYDVLVTVWYNEDRARIGQHSDGYLPNRILFWHRRGSEINFNHDLTALRDYPIAVSRGYAYSPAFDQDEHLLKVPVRNFAMGLEMLVAGRVALAVEDERVGHYVLGQQAIPLQYQVEPIEIPLSETDLRILVSLKNPEHEKIVQGFNRAIAAMRADGTLRAMINTP
jgi:polar amino acid transport system substrate-binding protein